MAVRREKSVTDDVIAALVRDIYASAADPDRAGDMFAAIVRIVNGTGGWVLEFRGDEAVPILPAVNMNSEIVEPYARHFFRLDPWAALVGVVPTGVAQSFERHVSTATFTHSEIYNDLVRPTGSDILHNMSLGLDAGRATRSVTILRGEGREPFGTREERLLDALTPHLRTMFGIWDAMPASRARIAAYVSRLDFDAVLAIDRAGRVVDANAPTARLMARGSLVRPRADGGLRWSSIADQDAIDRLLRMSAMRGIGGRTIVHDGSGVAHHVAADRWPGGDGAATLLTVRDVAGMIAAHIDAATRAFGLSPGEALLARSLMAGDTIEAHAHRRGTSPETVRKQLTAIFRKTGTTRQAALVALLFGMVA